MPLLPKTGGAWVRKKSAEEVRELERIEQAIDHASSRHSELPSSSRWRSNTDDLVDKVFEEYDKLKNAYCREKNEKEQAQEWAKKKDQLVEHERVLNQNRLEDLEQKHQKQLRRMQEGFDRAMRAKDNDHSRRVADLESQHSKQLQGLIREHESEKVRMQQIHEDLKQGMSSREHIKGLADREVVLQFKKLSTDIEDFSRIDWDPHREADWPYSELEMRALRSQNVRKLKQHMVQNCLWLALHDCIFRTPFRIIGEYGEAFDSNVYEAYSLDYDALDETESADLNMKRHKNAEVFLAALNASEPLAEKDQAIRASYAQARKDVFEGICSTLSRVTMLDDEERSALDSILQSAARLWLEVASQRYRLFVIVPAEAKDCLSIGRGDVHGLQLVIKPDLQRFGNARGVDARQGQPISGWKRQIEVYPS